MKYIYTLCLCDIWKSTGSMTLVLVTTSWEKLQCKIFELVDESDLLKDQYNCNKEAVDSCRYSSENYQTLNNVFPTIFIQRWEE